jgi:hypothetical protein
LNDAADVTGSARHHLTADDLTDAFRCVLLS